MSKTIEYTSEKLDEFLSKDEVREFVNRHYELIKSKTEKKIALNRIFSATQAMGYLRKFQFDDFKKAFENEKNKRVSVVSAPAESATSSVEKKTKQKSTPTIKPTQKNDSNDIIERIIQRVVIVGKPANDFLEVLKGIPPNELKIVAANFENLKNNGTTILLSLIQKIVSVDVARQAFLALAIGKRMSFDSYRALPDEFKKYAEQAVNQKDSILVDLKASKNLI